MIVKSVASVPRESIVEKGVKGVVKQVLIGPADGAPNFSMRQFTVDPGGYTFYHIHEYEHEIFVLRGSGIARSGGEEVAFSADTAIFVKPGEIHQIINDSTEELVFLCLIPNQ
jgi:quercetin dioxygenase-like cupin family protein